MCLRHQGQRNDKHLFIRAGSRVGSVTGRRKQEIGRRNSMTTTELTEIFYDWTWEIGPYLSSGDLLITTTGEWFLMRKFKAGSQDNFLHRALYRETQQVSDRGWVDLDIRNVPSSFLAVGNCRSGPPAKGTPQILINPTQVRDLLTHPVYPILGSIS